MIAAAAARGVPVTVVVVTDGAASHPGSATSAESLVATRAEEARVAVELLGHDVELLRWSIADGAVREARAEITERLRPLLPGPGGLVVAPWRGDGHRDHRVLGEIAAQLVGEAGRAGATLLEYPIWLWHWGSPDHPDVPWPSLRLSPLDADADAAKRSALAAYVSQRRPLSAAPEDAPVLHPVFERHFARGREVFVVGDEAAGVATEATFDRTHARRADPWRVTTRWYERRKRALTVASLPREHYGSVLEVGCSIGVLTGDLAPAADRLLALDVSSVAVEAARERLADLPHVTVEQADAAADYPSGPFDLVVLSEVGYYLAPDAFGRLVDSIVDGLAEDGDVVACHWARPEGDFRQGAQDVHARLGADPRLHRVSHHVEADFVLDVFSRDPRSVAQRTGLRVTPAPENSVAALPVRAVAVVVPAHDEEELVSRALDGIDLARRHTARTHPEVRVVVVLVADACTDHTVAAARAHARVTVVEIDARGVGAARAVGVDVALGELAAPSGDLSRGDLPLEAVWIACTDADSVVPPGWIDDQLDRAAAGADVVIGTVRPDFADLSPRQIAAWTARHTPGRPNGHVHGANLGVRASSYRAVGGFAPIDLHEDNVLVDRLRDAGATLVASDVGEVLTSGRRDGRTSGGYAGYLAVDLLA
nr:SAM-dependent methyltransferase [Frigoribacterium sp. VKM Ac-2836]